MADAPHPYQQFPIIRIEVAHMKHAIMQHLDAYHEDLKKMLEMAVEKQLNPETISEYIRIEVRNSLERIVRDSVQHAVAEAINNTVYDFAHKEAAKAVRNVQRKLAPIKRKKK